MESCSMYSLKFDFFPSICLYNVSISVLHPSLILFIAVSYVILCIKYTLFAHLITDEHLSCFQFCALINKGAIKVLLPFFSGHNHSFLLGIFAGVELLGHRYMCHETFFSKMVLLISVSTSHIRGFQLFCVLEGTWSIQSSVQSS